MSAMEGKEGMLSSSTVGSIVELQSEQISKIASEYAERVSGWKYLWKLYTIFFKSNKSKTFTPLANYLDHF